QGGTLNLTANTVANATYSWSGPNGFTSNVQNPTINNVPVAASGTYSVTVTANGCTSNAAGSTNVTVTPTPQPTASNNSPICSGATLNLTASNLANATYSWTGPNGFTSNVQNPTITNASTAAAGTYSVVATASGCSSSNPATTTVVVNTIPNPPV